VEPIEEMRDPRQAVAKRQLLDTACGPAASRGALGDSHGLGCPRGVACIPRCDVQCRGQAKIAITPRQRRTGRPLTGCHQRRKESAALALDALGIQPFDGPIEAWLTRTNTRGERASQYSNSPWCAVREAEIPCAVRKVRSELLR